MLQPEVKPRRRWIGRVLVPLAIAIFAALMCAGPGSVTVPATMQLAAPFVCPAGAALQQIEQPGTDNGESVVYVSLKCVGAAGAGAGSPSVTGVFAVLAVIYFVVFALAALVAVAIFARSVSSSTGRAVRPLGAAELQQVRVQLAEGKKLEAIRLVRQLTGASLADAKNYVETLAPPQNQ